MTPTLAAPMLPSTHSTVPGAPSTVVPFGLTLALPVVPPSDQEWPGELAYDPEQQLTVTPDGTPFINSPSMATSVTTKTQTKEDNQLFTDNGGKDKD